MRFLLLAWFSSQAQPCWAQESPSSGVGGEGVALLHGKIKPFVRELGPPIRQAKARRGDQVALFGITDIALRCSGTLKITLSQPTGPHLIGRGSPALSHECWVLPPSSSDLSEKQTRGGRRGRVCRPISSLSGGWKRIRWRKQHGREPLSTSGSGGEEHSPGRRRQGGQASSAPSPAPPGPGQCTLPLSTQGEDDSSTSSSKGSRFLHRVCTVQEAIRDRRAAFLKLCCFPGRGR